jgi:hypothetical protein
MELKSLVNDDAEIDGAAAALLVAAELDDDVAPAPELLVALEDDDDDELPQAAIASAPETAKAARTGLLLSKVTNTPPP